MNELSHHGILGQKWGVRRFQNRDGSLTDAGKRRYAKEQKRLARRLKKDFKWSINDPSYIQKAMDKNPQIKKDVEEYSSLRKKLDDEYIKKQSYEIEKAASRHREEIDKIMKELGYDDPHARSDIVDDYITESDGLYRNFLKKWDEMGEEVYKKGKKVCDDILGTYGDKYLVNIINENMYRNFVYPGSFSKMV